MTGRLPAKAVCAIVTLRSLATGYKPETGAKDDEKQNHKGIESENEATKIRHQSKQVRLIEYWDESELRLK
ncbi:hypothetical protein T4B_7903 [Trichinella pseudospiralis]|uniref:Uncharacterized protein n=1 Tax=Trichinella pseudospiralis TaxID=6337 RepID=A0A0V1I2D8_TRIPS|nr:hypothetical protein T4B_7903 [Trichinella pseudospiralis]